jgi:hypothetical protein
MLRFIRRHNDTIVFGTGFSGDLLLALYGGLAHNAYFLYATMAALIATGLMTLPGLLRAQLGDAGVANLTKRIKYLAAPLHNTAGLGTICSGLGYGGTGYTGFEIAMGTLGMCGSISQFYGDWVLARLRRARPGLFGNLHAGKIATCFYLPIMLPLFGDALRVQSIVMFTAIALFLTSIACLWSKGQPSSDIETNALPEAAKTLE